MQTSFNLAMGSAMASIGLTIPTLAVASIWIPTPLHLGLGADADRAAGHHRGRRRAAPSCPGGRHGCRRSVHLTLFAAFLFLAMSP